MHRFVLTALVILFTTLTGASSLVSASPFEIGPSDDFIAEWSHRFLWPQDPSRPGQDLIELSIKPAESDSWQEPPASWQPVKVQDLCLPSGEVAARTRLLKHEELDGVYAFETEIVKEISAPTGDYELPHFGLPAIRPPKKLGRVLTFRVEEFVTPVHRPIPSSGPVILFSDDLEVLVISPLDNFMDAMTAPANGEWRMGFGGLTKKIPAGAVHRVLIVSGRGINDTLVKWGKIIQTWHNHKSADAYADVAMSYLGYWTDNGSYYYYRTEPNLNYHDTLLAVKKYADDAGIPYHYFQIDSWWYPKARINDFSSKYRGGCLLWEPILEMFPNGLAEFTRELGLPLVAHNRFFSDQSPYCKRYECVYGNDKKKLGALPIDPAFWDEIMDNAVSYGVKVYEQDWLYTNMGMIPWLREGLGNAASWYDAMAGAAEKRGLTLQLCMASPEFFLQQLKHGNATHARVSHDYKGGLAKSFFWVPFHEASLFAHAVGLWPFKDNFQTSKGQRATYMIVPENSPFEEALISALSGGPVGPSDRVGYSDRELIMRTCREDGLLLKPDRPATPIDIMWLNNNNMVLGGNKPWIIHTWSDHEIGRVMYVSAFNIWTYRMIDPTVSLFDLGRQDQHVVYDWRDGSAQVSADQIKFGFMPRDRAFYYVVSPLLKNGMAVIGETDKFITLSRKRFPEIRLEEGVFTIRLEGVPGEQVRLTLYSGAGAPTVSGEGVEETRPRAGDQLYDVSIEVPPSGETTVMVGRK